MEVKCRNAVRSLADTSFCKVCTRLLAFARLSQTFNMAYTASLLGVKHNSDSIEKTPASLLAMSLEKATNGTPPP